MPICMLLSAHQELSAASLRTALTCASTSSCLIVNNRLSLTASHPARPLHLSKPGNLQHKMHES